MKHPKPESHVESATSILRCRLRSPRAGQECQCSSPGRRRGSRRTARTHSPALDKNGAPKPESRVEGVGTKPECAVESADSSLTSRSRIQPQKDSGQEPIPQHRTRNEAPKPESHVESATSIFPLPRAIPRAGLGVGRKPRTELGPVGCNTGPNPESGTPKPDSWAWNPWW